MTYTESIYTYTPLGVANNEELLDLPKPELAYLIVDLIGGNPDFQLSDSGKSRAYTTKVLVLHPITQGLCSLVPLFFVSVTIW